MATFTQGELSAPAAGTVLANTGPLGIGPYYPQWYTSATTAMGVRLRVMDPTNSIVRFSMLIGTPANGTFSDRAQGEIFVEEGGRMTLSTFNTLAAGSTAQGVIVL